MMMTVALSKGKLLEYALDLFQRAGFTSGGLSAESRSLVIPCHDQDMTLLIVRPSDVPTYVEYGAADIGVVGKDMLLEQDRVRDHRLEELRLLPVVANDEGSLPAALESGIGDRDGMHSHLWNARSDHLAQVRVGQVG